MKDVIEIEVEKSIQLTKIKLMMLGYKIKGEIVKDGKIYIQVEKKDG